MLKIYKPTYEKTGDFAMKVTQRIALEMDKMVFDTFMEFAAFAKENNLQDMDRDEAYRLCLRSFRPKTMSVTGMEWIPVEDRLPSPEEDTWLYGGYSRPVVVLLRHGSIALGRYNREAGKWKTHDVSYINNSDDVIGWWDIPGRKEKA